MPSPNPITLVEYRPVIGFPFYRVGNDGSFWSRFSCCGRHAKLTDRWRRLYGTPDHHGYTKVTMVKEPKGKIYVRTLSRLILEAFISPCPPGMECCHGPDQTKTNNNLANLRWGTHQENVEETVRNGGILRGSSVEQSKLTEDDIPIIRQMIAAKVPRKLIAARFRVSEWTIKEIRLGKSWRHVG